MSDIELIDIGIDKPKAVGLIRELTGLGLKESKEIVDLVENGECYVFSVEEDERQKIIDKFSEIGAIVKERYTRNSEYIDEKQSSSIQSIKELDDNVSIAEKKKAEENFKPIISANSVSNLDRQSTMAVLKEVEKIIKESEEYDIEIAVLSRTLREQRDILNDIRYNVSNGTKKIILIGTIIGAVIGTFILPVVMTIVLAIIVRVIMNLTVKKLDLKLHDKENKKNAEIYENEHLIPLQKRFDEVYEVRNAFIQGEKLRWAEAVVGKDMLYTACINQLYELVKTHRADSLKEALNKYDDVTHKMNMEEMQAAIQNATEIAVVESVKQTAQLEQIEKNTHKAARAAQINAAYSHGIYRNTKELRRKSRK